MSSTLKAAGVAAAVFLAIIGVYFVFLHDSADEVAVYDESAHETDVVPMVEETPVEERTPVGRTEVGEQNPVLVTFEVLGKRSERRLEGASIVVNVALDGDRVGDRVHEHAGTQSDPGFFQLEIQPGAYLVRASCPRYSGERRPVTVVKDQPQTVVFNLERGSSISGRVLTQNGQGIGGARVQAMKELGNPEAGMEELLIGLTDLPTMTNQVEAETVTEPDGSYQLDGLKPKWYSVRAVAEEYAPNEVNDVPAPRSRVDIVLAAGGLLSGVVLDNSGAPVEGAELQAYPHVESQNVFEIILAKSRPAIDSTKTDASGSFRFATLGAGTFNFLVTAPGHRATQLTKFHVAPEGAELKVKLERGVVLEGLVQDFEGNPISGVRIRAQRAAGTAVAPGEQVNISFKDGSIQTDDEGRFIFDTLEEGKYTLLCWHRLYKTVRRQSVYPSKTEDLVIVLEDGATMSGYVTEMSTGEPIAGARVSATDVADLRKDTVTEENGYYLLPGLTSGRRNLSVSVTAQGYARAREDVPAKSSTELSHNFQLQPTAALEGLVVNAAKDPVANARVMVKKRGGMSGGVEQTVGNGVTDRYGRYDIENVEASGSLWLVVKKGEYLDARSDEFSVDPGESQELETVELRLGGAIAGTVTTSGGRPVSGCMVTLKYEGDTELTMQGNPSSGTNKRGEFRIQGLEATTVDLVIKAPHHLETFFPGVEVREGEVHTGIEVVLDEGNSIAGRVVDAAGEPVAGARIVVRDFSQGAKELRSKSDANGGFKVDGIVAEDSVELEVDGEAYAPYVDEQVAVGASDIDVVLKELGKLAGIVLTQDGSSLVSFSVHPQRQSERNDPRFAPKAKSFRSEDGTFEYPGVAAGTYDVYVGAPGYAAATIESVSVSEGAVVDLGTIRIEAGGVVTGQIFDPTQGAGVAEARVQIVQGQSRFVEGARGEDGGKKKPQSTVVTDDNGYFEFDQLRGGDLSLRVTKAGYATTLIEGVNPDVAATAKDIVIDLSRGAEINGTVVAPSGRPQRRMPVYLLGSDSTQTQSTNTDAVGRFRFTGLTAGSYTVKAHKFLSGQTRQNQATAEIELAAGAREQVILRIE